MIDFPSKSFSYIKGNISKILLLLWFLMNHILCFDSLVLCTSILHNVEGEGTSIGDLHESDIPDPEPVTHVSKIKKRKRKRSQIHSYKKRNSNKKKEKLSVESSEEKKTEENSLDDQEVSIIPEKEIAENKKEIENTCELNEKDIICEHMDFNGLDDMIIGMLEMIEEDNLLIHNGMELSEMNEDNEKVVDIFFPQRIVSLYENENDGSTNSTQPTSSTEVELENTWICLYMDTDNNETHANNKKIQKKEEYEINQSLKNVTNQSISNDTNNDFVTCDNILSDEDRKNTACETITYDESIFSSKDSPILFNTNNPTHTINIHKSIGDLTTTATEDSVVSLKTESTTISITKETLFHNNEVVDNESTNEFNIRRTEFINLKESTNEHKNHPNTKESNIMKNSNCNIPVIQMKKVTMNSPEETLWSLNEKEEEINHILKISNVTSLGEIKITEAEENDCVLTILHNSNTSPDRVLFLDSLQKIASIKGINNNNENISKLLDKLHALIEGMKNKHLKSMFETFRCPLRKYWCLLMWKHISISSNLINNSLDQKTNPWDVIDSQVFLLSYLTLLLTIKNKTAIYEVISLYETKYEEQKDMVDVLYGKERNGLYYMQNPYRIPMELNCIEEFTKSRELLHMMKIILVANVKSKEFYFEGVKINFTQLNNLIDILNIKYSNFCTFINNIINIEDNELYKMYVDQQRNGFIGFIESFLKIIEISQQELKEYMKKRSISDYHFMWFLFYEYGYFLFIRTWVNVANVIEACSILNSVKASILLMRKRLDEILLENKLEENQMKYIMNSELKEDVLAALMFFFQLQFFRFLLFLIREQTLAMEKLIYRLSLLKKNNRRKKDYYILKNYLKYIKKYFNIIVRSVIMFDKNKEYLRETNYVKDLVELINEKVRTFEHFANSVSSDKISFEENIIKGNCLFKEIRDLYRTLVTMQKETLR